MAKLSRKLIGLAFYRVDNHKGLGRQSFDEIWDNPKLIVRMLLSLKVEEEEYRIYYFPEDADILQEDYNDEVLDGGWWMVPLYETEKQPKNTHAVVEYADNGFGKVTYKESMDEAMAIFNARRDEYAKCEVKANQESRVPLSLYGLDDDGIGRHVEIIFVEGKTNE
jgi:hypothetical protein